MLKIKQSRIKEKEKEFQRIYGDKERQLQNQQFDLVTTYGEMELLSQTNDVNNKNSTTKDENDEYERLTKSPLEFELASNELKKTSFSQISDLESLLSTKEKTIPHLEEKLQTQSDYDEIKRELSILKSIEFSSSSYRNDEQNNDQTVTMPKNAVRKLLAQHNIGQRIFARYILSLSQGTVIIDQLQQDNSGESDDESDLEDETDEYPMLTFVPVTSIWLNDSNDVDGSCSTPKIDHIRANARRYQYLTLNHDNPTIATTNIVSLISDIKTASLPTTSTSSSTKRKSIPQKIIVKKFDNTSITNENEEDSNIRRALNKKKKVLLIVIQKII
ncbi:unnamed protein product [Didymodactylos carnosus]|uniref:Uncharacterized protein n=2 Tax=Didymodactylos carnosus TaxID=1234261 RepID=A0A814SYA0_9BILA|nr:unnamed protein product [Didymodactylos carnosus]CAF3917203.1 unnamed protein product [Didymodactylos carnosus]